MKLITRLLILAAFSGSIFISPTKLDAYGYQPDSEGYAYTDSVTSVSSSMLMPIAVVSFVIILGVVLYTGHRGSDHTHRKDEQHHSGHCGH